MSTVAAQTLKTGNMAQACDLCRLKKRKCDLKEGGKPCSACQKSESVCQMTHVAKPREKRKKLLSLGSPWSMDRDRLTRRRKQMENLEDRLRSLEELIKSSVAAKPSTKRPYRSDTTTSTSLSSTVSSAEHIPYTSDTLLAETVRINSEPSQANKTHQGLASDLQVSGPGFMQALGRGSPQLPSEVSQFWNSGGSDHFEMAAPPNDVDLTPQVRVNGSKKCSMPPLEGGLFLLQEFLVDFNTAVPVFDASTITTLFHDCYSGRAQGVAIDWVAIKVVLTIAHRLRAMSPLGVPQDMENADIYFQEALAEVPRLLMLRPTLLLAECLLGLAVIISTSPRPSPAERFVTLALRVVQDLHVNDPQRINAIDLDDLLQQQRVFWIAYFMDADMSLRAGRLPTLSPKLINVELPGNDLPNAVGTISAAEGEFKVNAFRLHVELALLQAEFMEQLLLPRASKNPEGLEDAELRSIAARLEEWRRNWLFELSAENLRDLLHRSDLVHVIILESAYFSTAYALCAHLAPTSRTRGNPFGADGLMEAMSNQKVQLLYKDARRFADLFKLIPGENTACNWLALETIVSALVVMLAHIILNPRDETSQTDFSVSREVLQALHYRCRIGKDEDLVGIQNLCVDLYLQAESALQE